MVLFGFESSLCCAIRDNNMNLLSDLLRDSAEIRKVLKERSQWERKALSLAAFVYHGMARKGFSPLHVAAGYDRTEVIRILIQDYKAVVNPVAVGGDEKWTPLHEAVRQGKPESIKMLVSLGSDLSAVGKFGSELVGNPLQWARKLGNEECIRILAKMEYQRNKESELNFALDIQTRLNNREKNLEEKRRDFSNKMHELEQEKQRLITEHENFKCENAEERHQLIMGSGYRTESEIKSLMEEVADFEWPSVAAVRENEDSSDSATSTRAKDRCAECPICMEEFTNGPVYSCPGCDGLLCSTCVSQIKKCPLCRLAYSAWKKPARNKAVERILMVN